MRRGITSANQKRTAGDSGGLMESLVSAVQPARAGGGRSPRSRPARAGRWVLVGCVGLGLRQGWAAWLEQRTRESCCLLPAKRCRRREKSGSPGGVQQPATESNLGLGAQMQCDFVHLYGFTPVFLGALSGLVPVFP